MNAFLIHYVPFLTPVQSEIVEIESITPANRPFYILHSTKVFLFTHYMKMGDGSCKPFKDAENKKTIVPSDAKNYSPEYSKEYGQLIFSELKNTEINYLPVLEHGTRVKII